MPEPFELIVIGAGPAGAQGAALAAGLGKRVALVERDPYLGGAGLATGTMPSKLLREAAVTLTALRQLGLTSLEYRLTPGIRLADLMYNKPVVVDGVWSVIQGNRWRANVQIVSGSATFKDARTLVVTGCSEDGAVVRELTAPTMLIATGSASAHPPQFPFDHPRVCDPEKLLNLERLPRSVVIVGGGTIGCEYASILAALGVHVTLVEAGDRVLMPVDLEIAQRWQEHMARQGVEFVMGAMVHQVEPPPTGQCGDVRLTLSTGQRLAAEVVLVAVGRRGNLAGLGVEAAGLTPTGQATLAVNEHFQTAVPHLYAAGDVVGWPTLASMAMEHARIAIAHAFNQPDEHKPTAYPMAVYTIPEVAMVGLSEEACQRQGVDYLVGIEELASNPNAQLSGDTSGVLKLIFAPDNQRLLGVQIMAAHASELVHLGAQVLASGGTLATFTEAVFNYPTLSEAYKAAAFDGLERLRRRIENKPET